MLTRQRLRLTAGLGAIALILAACHGGSSTPSQFVPPNSGGAAAVQSTGIGSDTGIGPDAGRLGHIHSSCGHRLRIVLAGFVQCRFRERGYGNGTFTIADHTQGLVSITPGSGTRATLFTVTALVVGSGWFTVRDNHHHRLRVHVSVTL